MNLSPVLVSLIAFITSIFNTIPPVVNRTVPVNTVQPQTVKAAANADMSRNWSGYTAAGGTFTGVSGTWSIPQTSSSNNYGVDATWVGIGGVSSQDLIQAGTQQTVLPDGQKIYEAFYETLPYPSQPLDISVNGGDSVSVSINQPKTGHWQIVFKNNTTGQKTNINTIYNSSLSSADWIEEAPSSTRRVMPLDDFGSVQFTSATAVRNGRTMTAAQMNARAISMGTYGQVLATASVLGNDGTSFTVTRTNTTTIADQQQPVTVYIIRSSGTGFFRRHRFYFNPQ